MGGPLERYHKLRLRDSISISYRYPVACRDLGFILRLAYSKLPKPLQSLVIYDILAAFRLLPQMQDQGALSAANFLIQSAETSLPKQKKVTAVKEFKQAIVALKRQKKYSNEDREVLVPQDVLLQIFSYLDLHSLISAGLVCRSWNWAANDDYVWQIQYTTYFEDSYSGFSIKRHQSSEVVEDSNAGFDWKDVFRKKYIVSPWRKFEHNRGYCEHCNTIVWLNKLKCPNRHIGVRSGNLPVKPILSHSQVAHFVLDDSELVMSCLDSDDSDSDGEFSFKLWAYPGF